MHRHMKIVLAAAVMLGSTVAQGRDFDYPGADRTGFSDINDRGIALGSAIVGQDPYPFLLNLRTGELTNLTPLPGNVLTIHEGINNDGVIVGGLINRDKNTTKAFIREPDGVFSFFSHPRAHTATFATAINERGLIVGTWDTPDFHQFGFIYNPATGKFRNFGAGESLEPFGINKWGKVVGRLVVFEKDDPCGGGPVGSGALLYGFVRHSDGFISYFQLNRQQTSASDVTNDGVVVGTVYDPVSEKARIFGVRVPRERCVFLDVPRRKLMGESGREYVVGGINSHDRIVGVAIDRENDVFTLHGYITTLKR
jgi:hypothetical protein